MSRLRTLVCLAALACTATLFAPGIASAMPAAAFAPSVVVGGPMVRATPVPGQLRALTSLVTTTSRNWSGYAAATNMSAPGVNTVTDVSGTWVIPTVSGSIYDACSSDWVGIDGFRSDTVEQLGTASMWVGGAPYYYAWWEMFPAGETPITTMTVSAGDTMTAQVHWIAGNTFRLTMTDVTAAESFSATSTFDPSEFEDTNADRSSAEWIHETPGGELGILPLAQTTPATFTSCEATISGVGGSIGGGSWQCAPIDLVSMTNPPADLAVTSDLSDGGSSFVVQRSPGAYPGTISIYASPSSVKLPKPFVLEGLMYPGAIHDPCVVYVKKPGSGRWSYSSNRLAYDQHDGYSIWWYRYTPKLRGTYSFYVKFAGDADRLSATSKTIKVAVK